MVGDQPLHTQIGNIRVGSSLSALRTAFTGRQIEEHFNYDFGQGSNGVVVNGPGGAIAFSLADAPAPTTRQAKPRSLVSTAWAYLVTHPPTPRTAAELGQGDPTVQRTALQRQQDLRFDIRDTGALRAVRDQWRARVRQHERPGRIRGWHPRGSSSKGAGVHLSGRVPLQ